MVCLFGRAHLKGILIDKATAVRMRNLKYSDLRSWDISSVPQYQCDSFPWLSIFPGGDNDRAIKDLLTRSGKPTLGVEDRGRLRRLTCMAKLVEAT